jgi:hypothetical protein
MGSERKEEAGTSGLFATGCESMNDDRIFRPRPSKQEAKSETTSRVARDIIDAEVTRREAKTERLKAARLAREAAGQTATAASAKRFLSRRKGLAG